MYRNNTFYLTHNFEGKKSNAGTLFLDEHFSVQKTNENIVIHGHNMRDGTMFGKLKEYREKKFYLKHWLIQFDSLYNSGQYVIFAAFAMVNDTASPDYFRYIYTHFDTDVQFENYIENVMERSIFQCEIDILPTDALLTLSTCVNGDGSYFVVIARKIRTDEELSNIKVSCLLATFR